MSEDIRKKEACKFGPNCQKTNDREHKILYFHPCKNGTRCENQNDDVHRNRFTHPCKYGKNCTRQDETLHHLQFTHFHNPDRDCPCEEWECDKLNDNSHRNYRHMCSKYNCKEIDEKEHCQRFYHTITTKMVTDFVQMVKSTVGKKNEPEPKNDPKYEKKLEKKPEIIENPPKNQTKSDPNEMNHQDLVIFCEKQFKKKPPMNHVLFDSLVEKIPQTSIKIVSFNILAQKFLFPERYTYCKPQYYDWEYRKLVLAETLDCLDADLFGLQEVEKSIHGVRIDKSKFYLIQSNDDSLCILCRKDVFKIIREFRDIGLGERKIVQFVILEHLSTGVHLLFGNTHLLGDPKKVREQENQARLVCREANEICKKFGVDYYIQVGDFNMQPDSSTYKIFPSNQLVSSQGSYWGRKHKNNRWVEPPHTFRTDKILHTTDYIWTTRNIECFGACDLFTDLKSPIPDRFHSSDHIPIGSILYLKPKNHVEDKQPQKFQTDPVTTPNITEQHGKQNEGMKKLPTDQDVKPLTDISTLSDGKDQNVKGCDKSNKKYSPRDYYSHPKPDPDAPLKHEGSKDVKNCTNQSNCEEKAEGSEDKRSSSPINEDKSPASPSTRWDVRDDSEKNEK